MRWADSLSANRTTVGHVFDRLRFLRMGQGDVMVMQQDAEVHCIKPGGSDWPIGLSWDAVRRVI